MGKPTIGRDILSRRTLKTERVDVPEWDGEIILRSLSAAQATQLTALSRSQSVSPTDPKNGLYLAAWVLTQSWIDEEGARVATEADIDTLLEGNTTDLINRLGTKAMQISGLTPDAVASAAKNSESSQSNDSGTPSP